MYIFLNSTVYVNYVVLSKKLSYLGILTFIFVSSVTRNVAWYFIVCLALSLLPLERSRKMRALVSISAKTSHAPPRSLSVNLPCIIVGREQRPTTPLERGAVRDEWLHDGRAVWNVVTSRHCYPVANFSFREINPLKSEHCFTIPRVNRGAVVARVLFSFKQTSLQQKTFANMLLKKYAFETVALNGF